MPGRCAAGHVIDRTLHAMREEVRTAARGLWVDQRRVAPWEWRRAARRRFDRASRNPGLAQSEVPPHRIERRPRNPRGPGQRGLSVPVFNLQSLPGEDALEDAGPCVDEVQSLSFVPRVVWQSSKMWRARDRRARHHDDVPLALVVVSGYLFMGEPVWHVAFPVMRAKRHLTTGGGRRQQADIPVPAHSIANVTLDEGRYHARSADRIRDCPGNKACEIVLGLRRLCQRRLLRPSKSMRLPECPY